ncbi:MAG: SGNH/GDSL hydrolase family protein [Rikenellaceae bacterium]
MKIKHLALLLLSLSTSVVMSQTNTTLHKDLNVSTKFYLSAEEWQATTTKLVELYGQQPFAFVENNPDLPNVLIIGTSISIGYTPFVRENLAGKANVYRIPQNSNSTDTSLLNIDFWLGEMKWDVIHVNWGLHDLKYTLEYEHQDVPPAKYQDNLRTLFTRMSKTGAKIIWANTSYYPDGCKPRRDVGDDVLYNNLALEVLASFPEIIVDDQYSLTKANPQNQLPNNVHFTDEGYKQQALQASEVICGVL